MTFVISFQKKTISSIGRIFLCFSFRISLNILELTHCNRPVSDSENYFHFYKLSYTHGKHLCYDLPCRARPVVERVTFHFLLECLILFCSKFLQCSHIRRPQPGLLPAIFSQSLISAPMFKLHLTVSMKSFFLLTNGSICLY